MYILYLAKLMKRRRFFWKGQGKMVQGEITPDSTYFLIRLKKFLLFVEFE